jgi:hypothetical protein
MKKMTTFLQSRFLRSGFLHKKTTLWIGGVILSAGFIIVAGYARAQDSELRNPILIELFTSEGCSSCPPADALLQKLDRVQPVHGAQLIVLSEHVDYWNHIGWKDPYSSHLYSERQSGYASRFGLDSDYTPQMVVDGRRQFVGSDTRSADQALIEAAKTPKVYITVSEISIDAEHNVRAHVEVENLTSVFGNRGSEKNGSSNDVYTALVLAHAESQISGGENSGRRLTHTNIVRSLVNVGSLRSDQKFARDIQFKLDAGIDPGNLRLVAFVQERNQGQVLGAAIQPVGLK